MPQTETSMPAANRQPITDDRLTIADLARLLAPSPTRDEARSMNRSLIQRYDANKELQRLLNKQDGTYPTVALPYWEAIAQARAQEPPLVKPETAGVFLSGLLERQSLTDNRLPIITPVPTAESEALVVAREMGGDMLTAMRRLVTLAENMALTDDRLATIEHLARALDRHSDLLAALPAPDDALLEAADVQRHIPRGISWLRKNVPSIKVGRARLWKRSAVLAYIAAL